MNFLILLIGLFILGLVKDGIQLVRKMTDLWVTLKTLVPEMLKEEWMTVLDLQQELRHKKIDIDLGTLILIVRRLRKEGFIEIYDPANTWPIKTKQVTGANWVRLPSE